MLNVIARLSLVTLFEDDLAAAKALCQTVFQPQLLFEDEESVLFRLGDTLLNLLKREAALERIAPARVASRGAGARSQFTILVDDVDDRCASLAKLGVKTLNGPMDRPWGMRTAAFQDPSGHIWEIAKDLS